MFSLLRICTTMKALSFIFISVIGTCNMSPTTIKLASDWYCLGNIDNHHIIASQSLKVFEWGCIISNKGFIMEAWIICGLGTLVTFSHNWAIGFIIVNKKYNSYALNGWYWNLHVSIFSIKYFSLWFI